MYPLFESYYRLNHVFVKPMTLSILLTSRGLGSYGFVRNQRLSRALHVLCLYPKFILCSLQEAWHCGTGLFRVHPGNSWHPASTMCDVTLLNDITAEVRREDEPLVLPNVV